MGEAEFGRGARETAKTVHRLEPPQEDQID
jgi:hypothetical protein